MKYWLKFFFSIVPVILLIASCIPSNGGVSTSTLPISEDNTHQPLPPELESVLEIIQQGNEDEIISLIMLSSIPCSNVDGLGGPPQCINDETEGTMVSVLPIMGPEGHFIREAEIRSWVEQLKIADLFAIYKVSPDAYSDENYPAGEFAIVFTSEPDPVNMTFQIKAGKIIRVDYGFGSPPDINENAVEMFLLSPTFEGE